MEKRIYRPLEAVSAEEVQRILASGTEEERGLLSLQVGEHGRHWAQSQAVCLKLMDDESPAVRANAALGLSYIARTQGQLDERLVQNPTCCVSCGKTTLIAGALSTPSKISIYFWTGT